MKKNNVHWLVFSLFLFLPSFLQATQSVTPGEMRSGLVEKTERSISTGESGRKVKKRFQRLEKRLNRISGNADGGPDFTDPVAKWLWFGLIGLGLALLFSVVSYGLAGVVGFAAIVCLVIWIIKREQAV